LLVLCSLFDLAQHTSQSSSSCVAYPLRSPRFGAIRPWFYSTLASSVYLYERRNGIAMGNRTAATILRLPCRRSRKRGRLRSIDRLILVRVYSRFHSLLDAIVIVWWFLDTRRRRLVTIAVTSKPTAEWIAGQVTETFTWDEAPRHLISDRVCAFVAAYKRRIRAMGIRDYPAARSPWRNG